MNETAITEEERAPRTGRTLFALLFAIPVITTIAYGGTDPWAFLIFAPLFVALCGIWIVRSWRSGTFEICLDKVLVPIVCLIGLGLFQLLPLASGSVTDGALAVDAGRALTADPFATKLFIFRLIGYLVFFTACITFINTETRYRRTLNALIIFGGVFAFAGILQKLASPDAIWGVRRPSQAIPFGPYVNQHHFASLMVLLSGLAVSHLFGNGVPRQTKLLVAISALIMGIAVPLTSSRGGVIAYAVMLLAASTAYFVTGRESASPRGSLRPLLIGTGALLVVLFSTVIFLGGADSLLRGIGFANSSDDITSGRLGFWSAALKIFAANPITGAGLEAFANAFTLYDPQNGMYRVEQAHNEYLQMLADGGIIGIALVAAFIYFLFKRGFERIRATHDDHHRVTVTGALAGAAGILVHSIFDFPLRTAGNAFFFLLVISLVIVDVHVEHGAGHRRRRHRT